MNDDEETVLATAGIAAFLWFFLTVLFIYREYVDAKTSVKRVAPSSRPRPSKVSEETQGLLETPEQDDEVALRFSKVRNMV